ncbi:unnamed protein product [Arctia plantaginis]|uniref:Uncharacterized protein n=1 Tax=Arctia plantaginis TaxID=874455 RepID=A0A8S1AA98_ARCPL|nr:unnamed protein product [Arctia plantaginis]CAB3258794.1 unnamed protein product [Arctia plantaginis]
MIMESFRISDKKLKELVLETTKDEELMTVNKYILEGWPEMDSANSTVQASHVELIGTVEPTPRPYSGSTHRRRRGRRSLEGSQPRSAHEPTSRLEEAQRRLAEMESERTMAFTAALDRLATTIGQPLDRLATVISQLLQVYHRNSSGSPPLRKRARIIIPSESDSD